MLVSMYGEFCSTLLSAMLAKYFHCMGHKSSIHLSDQIDSMIAHRLTISCSHLDLDPPARTPTGTCTTTDINVCLIPRRF